MRKITLKSLLIIALAIIPMTFYGQEETASNHWFFGIEGGATTMFSDNQPFKMDQTSWDLGANIGIALKNTIYIYGNVGYVNLKGKYDDFFTIDECNLLQANINLGYDVLQLFKFKPNRVIAIIPHFGLGTVNHKSKTTFADGTVLLNGYDQNGATQGKGIAKRKNVFQNTFGVNFLFNLGEHFGVNLDLVGLKTDTEGLDNYRSGKHSDWYAYANIGLQYKFGKKDVKPCPDCPECEEPAEPSCDACADAIKQAVKEAVDDAMKNRPCEEEEFAPESSKANNSESAAIVPFKNIDLDLTFKVGSSKVEKTDANRKEIQEISDDIDNGVQFSTIKVEGYASPEGNDEQNQKLSEDRANATVEYIQDNLGDDVKDVEFQAEGMGSDWEGFYTALKNSNISNKAEIEKSIKEAENPTAKLNELKKQNPALEELLKNLRRTRVSYIE